MVCCGCQGRAQCRNLHGNEVPEEPRRRSKAPAEQNYFDGNAEEDSRRRLQGESVVGSSRTVEEPGKVTLPDTDARGMGQLRSRAWNSDGIGAHAYSSHGQRCLVWSNDSLEQEVLDNRQEGQNPKEPEVAQPSQFDSVPLTAQVLSHPEEPDSRGSRGVSSISNQTPANQNTCSNSHMQTNPHAMPRKTNPSAQKRKVHLKPSPLVPFSLTSHMGLVTSLLCSVILVLSVMTQHATGQDAARTETPEWITEPSDTKIPESGSQTIYCRIRNRGDRQIAWIQYQPNGDVRNLFIDKDRWAAPDR